MPSLSASAPKSLFEKTLEEHITKAHRYICQVEDIIHILIASDVASTEGQWDGASNAYLAPAMFDVLHTLERHRHQLERMHKSCAMNSRQN
jgi:hypothetical protein